MKRSTTRCLRWVVRPAILILVGTLLIPSLASAAQPEPAVAGTLLFVQLLPGPAFVIDPSVKTQLTEREIEAIENRYGRVKPAGTLAMAHTEEIETQSEQPWRAVIVITRQLEEGDAPRLKLPAESSVVYLQGRPKDLTDRGWIITSPEANQWRSPLLDADRSVRLEQDGRDAKVTRFAVVSGTESVADGIACRWP